MTPAQRRERTAEAYQIIANELGHHVDNGSEFLHLEDDGSDSPTEVVALRLKVLGWVRVTMQLRARRLRIPKRKP